MIYTRTVHSDDKYFIELHDKPSNTMGLVASFSSVHAQDNEGFGLAGRFLTSKGYDVLSIKPKRADWYVDFSDDPRRVQSVRDLGSKYKNFFGYGISMGAFGALFLQDLLSISRVAAISARRPSDAITISAAAAERVKSMEISLKNKHQNFYIYDAFCQQDDIFSSEQGAGKNVFNFAYAGHPVSAALKALGKLKELTACAIGFDEASLQKLIGGWTIEKEKTTQYFVSLASVAFQNKDFGQAIECFESAQKIDQHDVSFYGLWSEILFLSGEIEAAIEVLLKLRLTRLWSGDSGARLAYYFYKNGQEARARELMVEAIKLDSRQLVMSQFAKKLGIQAGDI